MENNMNFPAEMFHLTKWKPIPHADYVVTIGEISLAIIGSDGAVDETEVEIKTHLQTVEEPGRQFCLVTTAPVVKYGEGGSPAVFLEPYLMIVFDPETAKTTCFRRTDVHLVDS